MSTCLLESKCANENNGSVEEVEGECLVECVVHNQRKGSKDDNHLCKYAPIGMYSKSWTIYGLANFIFR